VAPCQNMTGDGGFVAEAPFTSIIV